MPDDLLRHLSGPTHYSWWWLAVVLVVLAVVIGWCVAVFVWTMPAERLRTMPLVRGLHSRLVRRKFTRAVDGIRASYRGGGISAAQASAAIRRTVRSFLHVRTGDRAQYMHLGDLASGRLAAAAPLVDALNDVQFSTAPRNDVDELAASARELIRSWT